MHIHDHDELSYLTFSLLEDCPKIRHGVFTRRGGHSQEPYGSLNVGRSVGDNDSAVEKNLQQVQDVLGVEQLFTAKQVHGKEISEVNDGTKTLVCDALMTEKTGLGLLIKHADCQVSLFYDPLRQVVAAVHAGWRGLVQNIYAATVQRLQARYGSCPEDLLVCIGPSLGPDKAEFIHYKEEFPPSFWSWQSKPFYFDLWGIAQQQLCESGVLSTHIECARLCTYSQPNDFFSYRRDGVTGRNATVIALR